MIREIQEFGQLAQAEQPEVALLWQAVADVLDDQFVPTAKEGGIKRWESMLQIQPMTSNTLDERRFRILTRLNQRLPYTWNGLRQQLSTLCGADGYTLELQHEAYTVKVRVALKAKANYGDVDHLLERMLPANLVIDLSLKYNQHMNFTRITHAAMKRYKQEQLRNEVVEEWQQTRNTMN